NMFDGDHCRALGNAVSVGFHGSSTVRLLNNTITGEGDCLVLSGGGASGARLELTGNVLLGQLDWRQPWEQACAHYSDGGQETVAWSRNAGSGVKNGACPGNSLCASPQLASANLSGFDPHPLAGSPLVDAADRASSPDVDHYGHALPAGA